MKPAGKCLLPALFCLILLMAMPLWAQPSTIKIGLLAPMTGPSNADWGKKQVIGLEMAIAEANGRGGVAGIPLEAVMADTGGDPRQAVAMYRKLVREEGVLAFIGPLFTSECIDLFPVTNEETVAVIATGSSKPGLSDLNKWPYAFRMTVTSEKKEIPLARRWVNANAIKEMVILYDRESGFSANIAENLWPRTMKELNVRILNEHEPLSFPLGHTDFTTLVEKALAYPASGIGIAALPQEAGLLIKELRRQGYGKSILGISTTANPKVIEIAGPAAENLWSMSLFYPEDPNPKVRRYVQAFTKKCTDRYPGMNCDSEQYDVVVHDILLFVANIMKKKGVTGDPEKRRQERDKIRQGLADMGVWRGTAGMMAFDQKGDGIRTIHILKVEDGQWQHVR